MTRAEIDAELEIMRTNRCMICATLWRQSGVCEKCRAKGKRLLAERAALDVIDAEVADKAKEWSW